MFNLFSRKKKSLASKAELRVDLHSHLIPGIDDGAQTDEESLDLARGLQVLGFSKCITTPHIYLGLHNNTKEKINEGLSHLKHLLTQNRIALEVEAAAEYFFDENFFDLIEKKELMTFGGNYILFELPFTQKPVMLDDIIFKINLAGYQPVLAHPERYSYFHDKRLTEYSKLKSAGVLFQLNLMSLADGYGRSAQIAARDLLDKSMIEFAGSDLHREKQLSTIESALHDSKLIEETLSGRILNQNL